MYLNNGATETRVWHCVFAHFMFCYFDWFGLKLCLFQNLVSSWTVVSW